MTNNIISRFFGSIDVFASKIQLTIFQNQQQSSLLSQMLTIIVAFTTIIILKDDLYNVLSQSQPQVLNTQQNQQEPPVIQTLKSLQQIYQLQSHNFTYAMRVFINSKGQVKPLHGIDKYYQYSLTLCHRKRYANTTETNNCSPIPLEQCSLDKHFQTKTQYEYFKLFNMTSMRCISYEWWNQNQLLIGGTIYSEDFYYLNLYVTVCKNTTQLSTCSPQDVIDQKLQGANVMTYITTNQIDHSKKGNPYSMSIKGKYTAISQIFQKTQSVTYSASKTLTDVGYISSQMQEQEAILISDIQEFTDQIPTNLIMFNQVLLLDDVLQVSIREYDKISKVIGQIGGLFSVLYQFIHAISYPLILAGLKFDLVSWITSKNIQETNSQQDQSVPYLTKKFRSIKNILKILFGVKIENQSNLELILKLLDINYLMEKILEIDKIKLILFDDEQFHLFNTLPLINQGTTKIDQKIKKFYSQSIGSNVVIQEQQKIPKTKYYNKTSYKSPSETKNKFQFIGDEFQLEEIEEGRIHQLFSSQGQRAGQSGINSSRQPLYLQSDKQPKSSIFQSQME